MKKIKRIIIICLILSALSPSLFSCEKILNNIGNIPQSIANGISDFVETVKESVRTENESETENLAEYTTGNVALQEAVKNLTHEDFDGENAFMIVNEYKPFFTEDEITTNSYERYGALDSLGRCTTCAACVGIDLMPTEKREDISSVKPTGWTKNGKSNNREYDFVDGKWVYNRCHMIGFQLTGENANERNLITGTRFLNIDGMLSFENMIADAVKEKNIHVMYRVTPVFKEDNLVCEGLLLEGFSVEDNGETIEFCVFSFNVQPGVEINYKTGENKKI